jgi:hypothetical protein
MEQGLALFSKVQYGIAFLTAGWLFVNWLRPKVAALRASLAAKAAAASKSVSEASLGVAPPATTLHSAGAE